jgi:hypothetical protein
MVCCSIKHIHMFVGSIKHVHMVTWFDVLLQH